MRPSDSCLPIGPSSLGSHRTYRRVPAMTSLPWRLTGNRRARVLVDRLTRRAETDGGNRQASQVPGEPQRWPRRLLKTPAGPPSQAGTGEQARPPHARTAGAPAMRPNFGAGWAGSGHTLSTLRPVGRPTRTQDSLPAVGQTLPGGLSVPLGSSERFRDCFLHLSPLSQASPGASARRSHCPNAEITISPFCGKVKRQLSDSDLAESEWKRARRPWF